MQICSTFRTDGKWQGMDQALPSLMLIVDCDQNKAYLKYHSFQRATINRYIKEDQGILLSGHFSPIRALNFLMAQFNNTSSISCNVQRNENRKLNIKVLHPKHLCSITHTHTNNNNNHHDHTDLLSISDPTIQLELFPT